MKGRTDDCVFCTLYALWEAFDEMGEKRHVAREEMETRANLKPFVRGHGITLI